jgi:hypothetical protein
MPWSVIIALVENLPDIVERDGSQRLNMSQDEILDECERQGHRSTFISSGVKPRKGERTCTERKVTVSSTRCTDAVGVPRPHRGQR